jgi:hypothetical protein
MCFNPAASFSVYSIVLHVDLGKTEQKLVLRGVAEVIPWAEWSHGGVECVVWVEVVDEGYDVAFV